MEKVRCAVLGIGSMGKKYALMADGGKIDGLELSAVCCRSEENAKWAAENLKSSVKICRGEDALYENGELFDAVIIVTPHKSHPAMAIRALNAKKHVLCDKPAGVTFSDAETINAAAEKSGKVYAMMCHQRTYPHYVQIKKLLDEGAIGKTERILFENTGYFRTEYYHRSAAWRSSWTGEGGGALINQGYHLLDMWQYLFGLPQSVYAEIPFGKYNGFDVDDEATVIMNYPDKLTGTFVVTTGEGGDSQRLEIVGTKGRILLDGYRLTVSRFDCDIRDYMKSAQVTSRQELKEFTQVSEFEEPQNAYEKMLENFASAVLYGRKPIAEGCDSAKTLSIINAAYLSAWKGGRVSLPIDSQEYARLLREKELSEK